MTGSDNPGLRLKLHGFRVWKILYIRVQSGHRFDCGNDRVPFLPIILSDEISAAVIPSSVIPESRFSHLSPLEDGGGGDLVLVRPFVPSCQASCQVALFDSGGIFVVSVKTLKLLNNNST